MLQQRAPAARATSSEAPAIRVLTAERRVGLPTRDCRGGLQSTCHRLGRTATLAETKNGVAVV